MRIDSVCGYKGKRVCISIDQELFNAFSKFIKKREDILINIFKEKIKNGEIKNSLDAKLFIYSHLMKPSAMKCFTAALPNQVDIEDI